MSASADSTAKAKPSKRYQDFHFIHILQNTERKEQRKNSLLPKAGQLSELRLALAVWSIDDIDNNFLERLGHGVKLGLHFDNSLVV